MIDDESKKAKPVPTEPMLQSQLQFTAAEVRKRREEHGDDDHPTPAPSASAPKQTFERP